MERRGAAGVLLALAACFAYAAAAPTTNEHSALELYGGDAVEGCYYNFQHYSEGDRIMTNEPCLNCTCHNRMLMCYLRVCPFTKPIGHDCTVEKRADQCCPIVTCPHVPVDLLTSTEALSEYGATGVDRLEKYGCSINERYYSEGSKVPSTPNKPCEHCYCIRNMTTCVMQECTLHVDGCTPIYHKDVCCPVRYSCDHPEDEIPQLEDMTTTVRPTPGFILPTTVSSVTQECVHNDEIFADGALIKTEKACEHCYCMKGDIVCVVQECGTPMENEGKNCTSVPPRDGQCCPDTYICEGDNEIIEEQLTTLGPRTGEDDSEDKGEGSGQVENDKKTELDEIEGSGFSGISDSSIEKTSKIPEDIEISPTYTRVPATPSIIIDETKTDDQFFTTPSQDVRKPVITVPKTPEEKPTVEPDQGENTVPYGGLEEETSSTSQPIETLPSSELPHLHEVEGSTTAKSAIGEIEHSKKPSSEKASTPYSAYSDIYTIDYTATEETTKGPETVSDITVHETSKTVIYDFFTEQNALPDDSITEFPHADIDSSTHRPIIEASTVIELQAVTETKPSDYTKEDKEKPGTVDENIIEGVTSIEQQTTTVTAPSRHAEEKEKPGTVDESVIEGVTSIEQQTTIVTEPSRHAEEKEKPGPVDESVKEGVTSIEQQTTTVTEPGRHAEEKEKTGTVDESVIEGVTSIEQQTTTVTEPSRHAEEKEKPGTVDEIVIEGVTSIEQQTTTVTEPSRHAEEKEKPGTVDENIKEGVTSIEQQTTTVTEPSRHAEEKEKPGTVDESVIEGVTSIEQQTTTVTEPSRHTEEKVELSTAHLPAIDAFTSIEQQTTTESEPSIHAEKEEKPSTTQSPIIEAFTTIEQQTTTETEFVKYEEEEKKPSTTHALVTEASTSIELQMKTESEPVKSGEGTEKIYTTHRPIFETSTSVEIQATTEKEPSGYPQKEQKPQIILEESSTKIVIEELTTESHTTNIPDTISPGVIPGEGSCLVDGTTYENQSIIPVRNKCQESCKCMSSIVKCEMTQCSPPPENMINCVPEYDTEDMCCPTYTCDHAKETIPPQPHSQMSATEKTLIKEDCDENCIKETKEKSPTCEGIDCASNIVPVEEENIKPLQSSELCSTGQCNIPEVSTTQEHKPCDTQDCISQPGPLCTDGDCEFSSVKPPEILQTPERTPADCKDSSCEAPTQPTDQPCVDGVNCTPTKVPHITCEDENCTSKVEKKPCEGESECDYSIPDTQVPVCEGESCAQPHPDEQPHISSTECKSQDCISPAQFKPDSAVRKEDSCINGQDCKPITLEENEIPVEGCKGNDCYLPDSDNGSATVQSYTLPDDFQSVTTILPKLTTRHSVTTTSSQPVQNMSSDSDQFTESIYDMETSTKIAETQVPELQPIPVEKTTSASPEYSSIDITFNEPEQTTKIIADFTPDMYTPTDKRTSEPSAPTEFIVEPEKSTETIFSVATETEKTSQKTDSFVPETEVTQETLSTLRPVEVGAVDTTVIEVEKSTDRIPEVETKIDTEKSISPDTITSTEFNRVGEPETDNTSTFVPEIKLTGSSHVSEPELDVFTEKYETSTDKFGIPTDSVSTPIVEIDKYPERVDTSSPESEASVFTIDTTKPVMGNITEPPVTLAPEKERSTQNVVVSTTEIKEFTDIPFTSAPKIDTTQYVNTFLPEHEKSTESTDTSSENIEKSTESLITLVPEEEKVTKIAESESEKSTDIFATDDLGFEKSTKSTILSTEQFTHITDTSHKEEYSTESGRKPETESVEFAEVTDVPHTEKVQKPSVEAQLSTKTIEEVSESSFTTMSETQDSTKKSELSEPSMQSSTKFIHYTDSEITTETGESPVTQKSTEFDETPTLEKEVTTTLGSEITSKESAHSGLTTEITTKPFDQSTKTLYTSPPDIIKSEVTSTTETEEFIKLSDVSSAVPTESSTLMETEMTPSMLIPHAETEHHTEADQLSGKPSESSLVTDEDTEKPTVDSSTDKTEFLEKGTEKETEEYTVGGMIATTDNYKRKPEYTAVEDEFTTSSSDIAELQTTKEPTKVETSTDEHKIPVAFSETTEVQSAETEVPPFITDTGKVDFSDKEPEYPAHVHETHEITSKIPETYSDNTEEAIPERGTEKTEIESKQPEYHIKVHETSTTTSGTPEMQNMFTEGVEQPDSFEKKPEYTIDTKEASVTTSEIPAIQITDTEKVIIDTRKPEIPISELDEGKVTTFTPAIEDAAESDTTHIDLEKVTESTLSVSESTSKEKLEPEVPKDEETTSYVAVTTSIEKEVEKATDVSQTTTEAIEFVREKTTPSLLFSSSESTIGYELERKPSSTEEEKPAVTVSDMVEKVTESFIEVSEQTDNDMETTTAFMVELEEHPHKPLDEKSTVIPELHKVEENYLTTKQKEESATRRPYDDETHKLSTEIEAKPTPSPEVAEVTGGAYKPSGPEVDSKEQYTTSELPSHVVPDENIVFEPKDKQSTLLPEITETPSDVTAVESDASTLPVLDSKKETPIFDIFPTEKVSLGPDYQTTEQGIYIKEHDKATEKLTTLYGQEHTTESKESVVFDDHISTVAQEKPESSTQTHLGEHGSKDITEVPFDVTSKIPDEEKEYTLVPQFTSTHEETTLEKEEEYLPSSTTKPDSVVSDAMSHKEQITTSIPIEKDSSTKIYDGQSVPSSTEAEQIPDEPTEEQRKPVDMHVETTFTPIEEKPTTVDKETLSESTPEKPAVSVISESTVEPEKQTPTHLTEETEKTTVSEEPDRSAQMTEKVPVSQGDTISSVKPEDSLGSSTELSTAISMELSTEMGIIISHSEETSERITDSPHTTSQKEILMESTESLSDSSPTSRPQTVSHDLTTTAATLDFDEQYSKTTPEIEIKDTAQIGISFATDKLVTDESESPTEIPEILTTSKIKDVYEDIVRKPTEPPTAITTESEQMFGSSTETAIDKDKPEEQATTSPALEEVAKPDKIQPTASSELPSPSEDIDHQMQDHFPPSGSGTYGTEPDYGEDDQAFGPGTCRYGGKVYVSAQQIPRDDPCDFCFCFRSDIICLQQSCPPPIHGCHEEPIEGFCCPRYECPVSMATSLNVTTTTTTTTTTLPPHFLPHAYKGAAQKRGCQIKGHSYNVGEVIKSSSGPCLHCTCGGDGQMKCDPKACTPEPMLRQMIAAAVSSKRRR